MGKTLIILLLCFMTLGMFLGSYSKASNTNVIDTGITKISQLLQPEVIKNLDPTGAGKGEITGVSAGAGLMLTLTNYINGNSTWSSNYGVIASSNLGMTTALDKAYNAQQPIVVTLWSPHWAFSKYNLTYLQDDVGIFGPADNVVTLTAQGLNQTTDGAHLYNILSRFHWTLADCNSVMLAIQNGATPAQAAQFWISAHASTVAGWVGSDNGTGTYTYGYVAWSDTIANANVLKLVLEQSGYTMNFKQLMPGVLYSGLSDKSVDFTTSAWLPQTQANYWDQYNSTVDWVRSNLEGAKVGLVVPSYMTESSYWSILNQTSKTSSSVSITTTTINSTVTKITSAGLNPFYIIAPLVISALIMRKTIRRKK